MEKRKEVIVGVKFLEALQATAKNAQFLETYKSQVADISRMFQVPLHMLADLKRATFSNIEHQGAD